MATRKIKDAKDLSTNELIYIKGHAKATYMSDGTTVEDAINNIEVDLSDYATKEELSSKQDKLLSGTNIKTVNGESLLGEGNIDLSNYETKVESQNKLQEAKSYTDIQIQDIKDGIVEQVFEFGEAGTYWISFYIEISLEDLCNALGSNGTKISTSTDGTELENLILEYSAENDQWSGNLIEIDPLRMYMVTVSVPCTISLRGKQLNPEKKFITLKPGWNWIGYPIDKETTLSDAFSNLNVYTNDKLKFQSDISTYFDGFGWWGDIQTLTPGQGYMYYNNTSHTKSLVFSEDTNYVFETKIDAQSKLEESKDYTDNRISEIKERVVYQTIELQAGWNWVSFYINVELVDLQNALGSNGVQIKDDYDNTLQMSSGDWIGNLSTIKPYKMYMINVEESCSITLEGKKLDPNKVILYIEGNDGSSDDSSIHVSYISYPLSVATELDKALINLKVVSGDVIKSRDSESEYIDGYGWVGDLTLLEPGKGYKYISNSTESFNFTYPPLELDVETELAKKQDILVSGTNIKTVNGESLLGEGNITIESGSEQIQSDWNETDTTSKSYIANKPNIRQDAAGTIEIGSGIQYTILNGQTFINKLFSGGIFANDYVFKIFDINENELVTFNKHGDGTKFLAGDCTYKSISTAYPQVNHGTSDTTFALTPNVLHVWDEVAELSLTLANPTDTNIANEYLFQFTSGATATTLTLPDTIKWANDAPIDIAENMIYQVSILNNCGTILGFI